MLQRIRQFKKTAQGKAQAGFTIIEVMIVLAIAGVIMGIVFLAIPNLQKSNRNTQRKNDASRLAGVISEYASNNNGKLPASLGTSGSGVLDVTKTSWGILNITNSTTYTATVANTVPAADTVYIYTGTVCGPSPGDAPAATGGGTARQFVIYWGQEGSPATQCLGS